MTVIVMLRYLLLAAAFLTGAAAGWAAPSITKVEPPNWWSGYAINPVRLLIHGSDLQQATAVESDGLIAGPVSVNSAGTYLFVDVAIPRGTPPGSYPLKITGASGSATAPFRVDAPLPTAGRFAGFSPDDVIYLIMPDRFADGDPANDDPAISRGLFDRKNSRFYHGGDFQGIIDHLPYLKKLGVTALWLTPVYDNSNHLNVRQQVNGAPISDYHGYGAVDYYGVEEHFGTLGEVRKLVDSAHAMGIKVIQDQVANHVGPSYPWVTDPPTPTWFHGSAGHHLKETFDIWNLIDPHASPALIDPVLDGWFADVLPDLNQGDPEVARYEIQNAVWWVATAGFDGIRQDTLPYVPRSFWSRWSSALKQQFPSLRAVGEVLDANPAITSFFQGGRQESDGIDSGIDSVFDYPEYFKIREAFARGKDLETVAKTMADDSLYPHAENLVTILGDHDVKRFMSEPGATVEGLKLAFTFLLTARGIPVIYYGDEIGMKGGNDPDNRRNFPGGWSGDAHNAFEVSGRSAEEASILDYVRRLTALRARLAPLRRGKMTELAESKQSWAYMRQSGSGIVIVALNNGPEPCDIAVHLVGSPLFHGELGVTGTLPFHGGTAIIHLAARSSAIYTNIEQHQRD